MDVPNYPLLRHLRILASLAFGEAINIPVLNFGREAHEPPLPRVTLYFCRPEL